MRKTSKTPEFMSFFPEEKKVLAPEDKTILEVALQNKIDIAHSCGGNGSCGTCLVEIESEELLPERTEVEQEMSEDRQFESHERLACQTICRGGWVVHVPPTSEEVSE